MKNFACIDEVGRILCAFSAPCLDDARSFAGAALVVEVSQPASPARHFWDGARVVDMPVCPGPDYQFDYCRKAWAWDTEIALIRVRAERDALLAQTDWLVIQAHEYGAPLAQDWATYRQALRDITEQPDLQNIQWPKTPE